MKLLKIKHWQLFSLMVVIPFAFQMISLASMIARQDASFLFLLFPLIMIFFVVLFFSWLYVLGTQLHKKLPSGVYMNVNRFKLFLLLPLSYLLLIMFFLLLIFNFNQSFRPNPFIFLVIVPLHIFSLVCIFYCIYFVAKALKVVEWQKQAGFNDFAGEFFLIWFFPIGIWMIQPRINKLFDLRNSISQQGS